MDFGDISANLPIIIIAVAVIILQFFLRRRPKPEKTPQEIAIGLLGEVGRNLNMVESFIANSRMNKFLIASWLRNKNRIDFLNQELQGNISDAFLMAEDYNRQMEAAKKQRSDVYMATIDMGKITDPLTKSKEGLEQWLADNFGTKEPPVEYPSMTDFIFGSRTRR